MPEPLTKRAPAANAPDPAPTRVVLATNPNRRGVALCCHHQRSDVATGYRVSPRPTAAPPPAPRPAPCRPTAAHCSSPPAHNTDPVPPANPAVSGHCRTPYPQLPSIPSYPGKGHASRHRAANHPLGQLCFGAEGHPFRHTGFLPPLPVRHPGYVPSSGGISVILIDVVQAAVSRILLDGRVWVLRSSVKVR